MDHSGLVLASTPGLVDLSGHVRSGAGTFGIQLEVPVVGSLDCKIHVSSAELRVTVDYTTTKLSCGDSCSVAYKVSFVNLKTSPQAVAVATFVTVAAVGLAPVLIPAGAELGIITFMTRSAVVPVVIPLARAAH